MTSIGAVLFLGGLIGGALAPRALARDNLDPKRVEREAAAWVAEHGPSLTVCLTDVWAPLDRCELVIAVEASGISAPPKNPWPARNTIMLPRLHACPHSAEKTRNSNDVMMR